MQIHDLFTTVGRPSSDMQDVVTAVCVVSNTYNCQWNYALIGLWKQWRIKFRAVTHVGIYTVFYGWSTCKFWVEVVGFIYTEVKPRTWCLLVWGVQPWKQPFLFQHSYGATACNPVSGAPQSCTTAPIKTKHHLASVSGCGPAPVHVLLHWPESSRHVVPDSLREPVSDILLMTRRSSQSSLYFSLLLLKILNWAGTLMISGDVIDVWQRRKDVHVTDTWLWLQSVIWGKTVPAVNM